MKLQHLLTIQTSHCKRMSKTWHHDMPQHSAILRSPSHTPGLDPLVANLVISQIDARDGRIYLQCLGQGLEAATDQGWRLVWGPFGQNLISEMLPKKKDIQLRHVESLWFKLGKTIQKSTVSFSIYIQYDIQLDWEYLTTQLDPRWTMKLQHLLTIQTSHCKRMSKTWHHDMPQHSAILRSPSHTPGLDPLVANLVISQIDARDGRIYLQCLGQGLEAATDQGWRLVRGPFGQNLIFEMLKQKDIQLRHVESLWFKTWKNNPEIHGFIQQYSASTYSMTYIQLDWEYLTTQLDPRLTMKLQHLQTIQTCHCHRMPGEYGKVTSWHAAAFNRENRTPGLGPLVANLVVIQIDDRDGRVYLQRLGQGLETETEQGWRLHPGLYRSNRDHWSPENTWHLTLTSESLWYRT